jgi:hypothetical protein
MRRADEHARRRGLILWLPKSSGHRLRTREVLLPLADYSCDGGRHVWPSRLNPSFKAFALNTNRQSANRAISGGHQTALRHESLKEDLGILGRAPGTACFVNAGNDSYG